jgi:hypothetical protein
MAQTRTAKYSIVCSDLPRNGKSLVARLVADYRILCQSETEIFDLSPGPRGLQGFFPIRSRRVDLAKTTDQMVLLDRPLSAPTHDYVVDVPSHLLADFFKYLREFGFSAAARAKSVEVVIYFVIDKASGSLSAAEKVRQENPGDRFIVVWNEAFLSGIREGFVSGMLKTLKKDGQLIVPNLPPKVLKAVEDPGFSFSNFVLADQPALDKQSADELKSILADVFHQLDVIEGVAGDAVAQR